MTRLLLTLALSCGLILTVGHSQGATYGVTYRSAQDGLAPLAVTFDARVPGSAQVEWDFGDGQRATGVAPLHTFYLPGTYQVNVQVRDGGRTMNGVLNVQVRDGGPESARITVLHGENAVSFSAEGSRIYAPFSPRWTLNGAPLQTATVTLREGAHVVRVDLQGRAGPVSKEVRFVVGSVSASVAFDAEVLRLTNDARARGWDCTLLRFGAAGKPPLARNAQLDAAARAQTNAMALHGYFAHVNPIDGSSAGERARAAGYAWTGVAENIAGGQTTPQEVVTGWLKSPGHCKNIMGEFQEIGLSYGARPNSELRTYWTQVFAKR
ncbi:CAP domain-containing protein [Deinococcus peraridilitoris]|uniref:Uncharacterized protein with SCP/PR1 domains n=1 Tax=Deinococcus peraridilitoris (strain DSM 19664 / LMG 22246 / CIP 109416 / KR-200) TaxID=937777 RepID=L0A111_DEIPD|nr:CAP domain-containing protein [Deinococcus peraridilitoris]AFZ66872.1 uncharacterized protein with SCP/PR1 domains [Deinococcus peraridilitoris DSM 19664]